MKQGNIKSQTNYESKEIFENSSTMNALQESNFLLVSNLFFEAIQQGLSDIFFLIQLIWQLFLSLKPLIFYFLTW